NFIRDIAPVANVVRVPNVIAVHPSFPAKTVPEFITHAKANPGKISMATAGNGSTSHIFGELFKMMAGVNLVAVPYRGGGPALIDRLNKEINAGLAEPKIKARFADIGGTALSGSPADFAKVIAEDTEKWGKVIRTAHIKPE